MHRSKSLKYWEFADKLENTPYQIKNIVIREYLERYIITYEDKEIVAEGYHNAAGIFNLFSIQNSINDNYETALLEILNAPYQTLFNISYSPGIVSLAKLYSMVQAACEESGVTITNVVERNKNYLVAYYLKTDAKAAMIQFYFNSNEQITSAMPKSTDGANDKKLIDLLEAIEKLTCHPSEV